MYIINYVYLLFSSLMCLLTMRYLQDVSTFLVYSSCKNVLLCLPVVFGVSGEPVHLASQPRWFFGKAFTTDGIASQGNLLLGCSPFHHVGVHVCMYVFMHVCVHTYEHSIYPVLNLN